jgi:hypothetical protein
MYYSRICLEGMRNSGNSTQDGQCPGCNSNRTLPRLWPQSITAVLTCLMPLQFYFCNWQGRLRAIVGTWLYRTGASELMDVGALTAVSMKATVLWVVTPCSSERVRLFVGTYCLHIQGRKSKPNKKKKKPA